MKSRVHVTGPVPARIASELERDFDLVDGSAGADGVLALLDTTVDDAYLESAGPQLKVVANYGVGVNNIDLDAARRRGIVVANTPNVLTRTTAELAITIMLALMRRVAEGDRMLQAARSVGILARVHARREPRRKVALHPRPRQDRPRDGAPRRGVRRDRPSTRGAAIRFRSCSPRPTSSASIAR